MEALRNVASWISLYLVLPCFLIMATIFVLFNVLSADALKDALREENTYSAVVPSVLSSASSQNQSVGQLPLQDPKVREAVGKAFPAEDIEQKTNTIIDSTFVWLEGETEKPEFSIDLTQNKEQLATELGNYAQTRAQSLPRCTLANLPDSYDALELDCLPPGISPASLAATVSRQVSNDTDFLPNPIITYETLSLNPTGTSEPTNPLAQLDGIRGLYENKALLLWLFTLLTIGLSVIGLLLANDRAKGLRRLGRSFLLSSVGLVVLALMVGIGIKRGVETATANPVSRDILSPVLTNLSDRMQEMYLIFAASAAVIAIILFIVQRKLRAQKLH